MKLITRINARSILFELLASERESSAWSTAESAGGNWPSAFPQGTPSSMEYPARVVKIGN